MRVFTFLTLFLLGLGASVLAHADSKPLPLFWWDHHWIGQDFKPYTEDSRISHSYRWAEDDEWTPQDWVARHGSKEAVIAALMNADIMDEFDNTNWYGKETIPTLEVGYAFNQLSKRQKIRVLKFVDYAYNVTTTSAQGAILIEDDKTDAPVGVYTKLGLQLN